MYCGVHRQRFVSEERPKMFSVSSQFDLFTQTSRLFCEMKYTEVCLAGVGEFRGRFVV